MQKKSEIKRSKKNVRKFSPKKQKLKKNLKDKKEGKIINERKRIT